ncbi:conserved hypothetical Ustilaginaceae-specific protein [Sporisorium reilianum SRZ2]|uniref:Conserved hypothetical Ustilaginaceae-specific protein n=1 Tax=Sporisorium reilianum (strain SRZ2) TaxID=999809 RepID=E6ZLL6_SPORE|nr:conserved hypothetical Ustilaginaceae-specific protein [Sporisorium reilianum SRZ2]
MVMFKPSFLLVSAVLALGTVMPAVHAGHVSLEINTDSEPVKRPKDASLACVAKSKYCRSPAHYTDVDFGPMMSLTTCHHDSRLKSYWNRFKPHGRFVNMFYVTLCPYDKVTSAKECNLGKVAHPHQLIANVEQMMQLEFYTSCNAEISCAFVDQVDDQCFPKK